MKGIKKLDIAIAIIFLALTILSLSFSRGGDMVRIDGAYASYIYPLDEDRIVSIPGPLGDTVVKIENSDFAIISSPCPSHTCLYMRMGTSVCCLPNKVLVSLEKSGGGADAISY